MKLPTDVSGQELVKALCRLEFFVSRQRGSHIILKRVIPPARLVVLDHKVIRPGTLRQILSQAGISVEQLLELL